MARLWSAIPRLLSTPPHVGWLIGLGLWLVVLPLCGIHVPPNVELIGGNYTNVTSAIGAAIAAGGTARLAGQHATLRDRFSDLETHLVSIRSHLGDHAGALNSGHTAPASGDVSAGEHTATS